MLLCAFAPAAEWTTFGGDPQRSNWAKEETDLTKDKIQGLKLEWKLKLDNESKELNSLTAPLVHSQVITPHGFKEVVLIAGASDTVFAIDADTGKLMWKKTMAVEGASTKLTRTSLSRGSNNATQFSSSSKSFERSRGELML